MLQGDGLDPTFMKTGRNLAMTLLSNMGIGPTWAWAMAPCYPAISTSQNRTVVGCSHLKDHQPRLICVAISFCPIHLPKKNKNWCEVLISWPILDTLQISEDV
jgi:hypothetical protein